VRRYPPAPLHPNGVPTGEARCPERGGSLVSSTRFRTGEGARARTRRLAMPAELGRAQRTTRSWLGTSGAVRSNHHDRTRRARVLARTDLIIILHRKVLSIYRSRNHAAACITPTAAARAFPRTQGHCCGGHGAVWLQPRARGSLGFAHRRWAAAPSERL